MRKKRTARRKSLKWILIDGTPYQDQADELKRYYRREEGHKQVKIKMVYGRIYDPMRPYFEIYVKRWIKNVL